MYNEYNYAEKLMTGKKYYHSYEYEVDKNITLLNCKLKIALLFGFSPMLKNDKKGRKYISKKQILNIKKDYPKRDDIYVPFLRIFQRENFFEKIYI